MNTSITVSKTASSKKSKLITMLSLWDHSNTAVKKTTNNICPGPKGKSLLLVVALSRCSQLKLRTVFKYQTVD